MRNRLIGWMMAALIWPMAAYAAGGGGGGGHGSLGIGGLGGGRVRGSGGAGDDTSPAYWLGLVGVLLCAYVFYLVSERVQRAWEARAVRRGASFVSLAVVLERGADYLPRLKALVERSEFDSPEGRAEARAALAALISPADVREGFLTSAPRTGNALRDGWMARAKWQEQMRRAKIVPEALNAFPHVGRRRRGTALKPRPQPSGDGVCVVGFVATTNRPPPPCGRTGEARGALHGLKTLRGDAFYFFYAPGQGKALSFGNACALLTRLRQDFHASAPNRDA